MKIVLMMAMLLAISSKAVAAESEGLDPREAELKMLRTAAKHHADDMAPLQARIRTLEKEVASLKSDKSASDGAMTALLKRTDDLRKQLAEAWDQIDRLKSQLEPSNKLAGDDGYIEVTAKQLETLGERYSGKRVKLLNCQFGSAANTHVDELPGITIASNGLVNVVQTKELEKWIGFHFVDSQKNLFHHAFAAKAAMGDYLATMKYGTRINISGTVIQLERTTAYGLVCDKVEKLPENSEKAKK